MNAAILDGAVVYSGGREFTYNVQEPDEDGHGATWYECVACEQTMPATDNALADHECPVKCPECGQQDEDVVVEISVRAGERFVEWRCCGQDVKCEHGRLLAQCTRFHGEP